MRRLCLFWVLSASLAALAQDRHSEVTLSVLANIPRQSRGDNVTADSTISGGAAGRYRFYFGTHMAAEVGYAFTRATFYYQEDESAVHGGIINVQQLSNIHELTGAFIYHFRPDHRLQPFVEAGGGVVLFKPAGVSTNTLFGAATQARGAFLYGGGIDYPFWQRFALRAQCRVMNYKTPDFFGSGLTATSRMMNLVPQLGIAYRF